MELIENVENPLVLPTRSPGFNPSHYALAGGICRFTGISSGANYIDMMTGEHGTVVNGVPTSSVLGIIGQGANFAANSDANFAGKPTTNDLSGTLAFIIQLQSINAGSCFFTNTTTTTGVSAQLFAATQFRLVFPGGGATVALTGSINVAVNVPYFIAWSWTPSGANYTCNVVIMNLATGVLQTATTTSASTGPAGPLSGTYRVANSAANFTPSRGVQPVTMFANNYLSLPQLTALAFDPWSFWYPQ